MPVWTLNQIADHIGGRIEGNGDLPVRSLAFDSRTTSSGEGILFIALSGEYHDGHDYINELYQRGLRAFLVSRLPDPGSMDGAGFCLVDNTLQGLQELAGERRKAYKGNVVAIAGSNGKTIVKEWAYQVLGGSFRVHRSPKSYNSQLGVPLSLWMMKDHHQLSIIEAGISRPGEMKRIREMTEPDVGLFTNLGTAHQESFASPAEKLEEKLTLFETCKKVIFCRDQVVGSQPLESYMEEFGERMVTWSLAGKGHHNFTLLENEPEKTLLTYRPVEVEPELEDIQIQLPFGDRASIENALHVFVLAVECGIPAAEVATRLARLEPVSMRLEVLQGVQGSLIINDSYNSDVAGLSAALNLMDQQEKRKGRVVILSDLFQSGLGESELYMQIAELVAQKQTNLFIGIGPFLMKHRSLFGAGSLFFEDTVEFLRYMDRSRFRDQTILIKGSRRFGFERITEELQLKSHQTLLEIDLNAMVNNLNYFRSQVTEGVKTMVMVKALSYGSGQVEIANLLQYHHVDYLAVAFTDEGVALRKAGIHLPILVLNPDPGSYGMMIDFRLEPEIYNLRGLEALLAVLRYREISGYPIHLKMDTGMHRLGLQEEEIESVIPLIIRSEFKVTSIFTHLAASGEKEHDDFSTHQIKRFGEMTRQLESRLGRPVLKHALNSAGLERFKEAQMDMVRLGIGLHGVGSSARLKPVSTFKSTISQVLDVKKGETVGYSRAGHAKRDSRIATIPVGYADGFNRNLGNGRGRVWINGQFAPTIGNICMDMTMVDITGIRAEEGDEVEIFGRNQPVTDLAEQAGTIPYELLTSIPERVKRVYLQE